MRGAPQSSVAFRLRFALAFATLLMCGGCWRAGSDEVVVYTALDNEFSQPVFDHFTEQSGVTILAKYDTESTKTVGLAQAIMAERNRPRCDVFWNNEILHTLRLQDRGLLEAYLPRHAGEFPAGSRDPDHFWHGFAARARVFVVNTSLVAEADRPTRTSDLLDERWSGRVGIAKPLFGTTATHAACLFAVWGNERAESFFRRAKPNLKIMAGNSHVARAVASGQLAWGITDTDDVIGQIEKGQPVAIVYPDQEPEGLGTLFIPNTVAILKGCPHPEAARRLVDYLVSPEVERQLANSDSAQIPLHTGAPRPERVESPSTIKPMAVDFHQAGQAWDHAARFLSDLFAE
jgi:iron(III) transport system substrate-binding protein